MPESYKPGVPHLDLANYARPDTKIPAEAIFSGPQNLKVTESSWPGYLDCPPVPDLIKNPDGSYKLRRVTANNPDRFETTLHDFLKNGNFSPTIDDVNPYNPDSFDRWRDAGEKYGPFEYVKVLPAEDAGYAMVSLSERRAQFPYNHTPLPKYVHDEERSNRRINYKGKEESWLENRRQDLINFLRTKEGQAVADELMTLGLSPEDIGGIVVGSLPRTAIYAVDRTDDGDIVLIAAYDAHDKNARMAKNYGVRLKDIKNLGLAEEIAHIWRKDIDALNEGGDLIALEMGAKKVVADKYLELAEDAGTDPKRYREADRLAELAKIKYHDLRTTPERYGIKSLFQKLYSKDRAALERILTKEAVEQGYNTREGISKYIKSRLMEIEEEVESDKPKSRLEKIVDEDSDADARAVESRNVQESIESPEAPSE